jgi:hypothetical protein
MTMGIFGGGPMPFYQNSLIAKRDFFNALLGGTNPPQSMTNEHFDEVSGVG